LAPALIWSRKSSHRAATSPDHNRGGSALDPAEAAAGEDERAHVRAAWRAVLAKPAA
jgi:hypothetical protein